MQHLGRQHLVAGARFMNHTTGLSCGWGWRADPPAMDMAATWFYWKGNRVADGNRPVSFVYCLDAR